MDIKEQFKYLEKEEKMLFKKLKREGISSDNFLISWAELNKKYFGLENLKKYANFGDFKEGAKKTKDRGKKVEMVKHEKKHADVMIRYGLTPTYCLLEDPINNEALPLVIDNLSSESKGFNRDRLIRYFIDLYGIDDPSGGDLEKLRILQE